MMENKTLTDMTTNEILEEFVQATHEAVKRTHEAGLATTLIVEEFMNYKP